jgi:hypothetical protein
MAAKKATTEKKPGLDIKDEMLYSDYKVFDWLSSQTPEMAKSFAPLVAMKWQTVLQSGTSDDQVQMLMNCNDFVNVGFWDLSGHPDLQWRLMCSAGMGKEFRHGWIPMATSKRKVGKLNAVLLELYPQLNDEELTLLLSKFTRETFKQLLLDMGKPDQEIKPLVDEFKKTHG